MKLASWCVSGAVQASCGGSWGGVTCICDLHTEWSASALVSFESRTP